MTQASGGNTEMLDVLNRRLRQKLQAERPMAAPAASPQPAEQPNVVELINTAIANLPGTEGQWAIIGRYSATDIKEKVFKARESLCLLRDLLLQG